MIIVYCALSPSLFSTLSLMFMLGNFAFTIGTPYYITKKTESVNTIRVYSYPIQRVTCFMFIAGNVGAFIYKMVVYYTGISDGYQSQTQQFLEIQGPLNIFLPLLMLPFAIMSSFIRTNSRNLSEFTSPINKLITIPVFLSVGLLILLIQIFTISVSGFLFFICILVLFIQRKIDFSNIYSWLIVIAIQIICLIFIVANFLAISPLLGAQKGTGIFQFYGINSLNDFVGLKNSSVSQGYFICLCLLFIDSCVVQRIFAYQNVWDIANKLIGEQKSSHGQNVAMEEEGSRYSNRTSFMNQQKQTIKKQRKDSRFSLQQFELPIVTEDSPLRNTRRNRSDMRNHLQEPLLPRSSLSTNQKALSQQAGKSVSKQPLINKILTIFLTGINKVVDFIYSTQFSLRFTEIMSIIVIQRYNNIYSFIAVLWLSIVASTNRIDVIFYLTGFVLLPVQIGNFVIMYFYNASESPISYLQNLDQYGFHVMQTFWLDIIIFNVYLFYMITFLLSASREKQVVQRPRKIEAPGIITLLIALFFRYSYLLTIGAIFFMGFSNVTLMNFIYLIMFLVFFSSGENILVETKEKNGRTIAKLTTFSRKYWFVIVYYTLLCVIIKYAYFLFFDGDLTEKLQPTGINQQYNWSFNFSLSSICISNTTPLFIIFILSQAQIMIYRSSIYLTYSFALVSHVVDKKRTESKLRGWLNYLVELFLQFYLQSLYYISGIIIIGCSYRWNILSLTIIIATCYGLMVRFNKIILAFIVFMDLSNIILNYFVLFTDYEIVRHMLGESFMNFILQFSLFLGLLTSKNAGLASTFALNVVIFYFAVESYGLKKILEEDRINEDGDINRGYSQQIEYEGQQLQNMGNARDTLSAYQPTIIESQYDDIEFGRNFNRSVILATKRMYGTILWKKYSWWQRLCRLLSIFSTDVITVFVLVSCLVFRLSVSMFYFLLCYMMYYFVLFDRIGLMMEGEQFYQRIEREFRNYRQKEAIICDRNNPSSMITGDESTQSVISFIDMIREKYLKLRFYWRQKLWMGTSIMVVLCLVLTYTSQFVVSQFYIKNIYPYWVEQTNQLQNVLFVLGISVTKQVSLFRQVYFYYVMIIVVVMEKLLIGFVEQISKQEVIQVQPFLKRSQIQQLQDASNFIDYSLNFIENVDIKNEQMLKLKEQKVEQNDGGIDQNYSRQSNLLIYFEYKKSLIEINYLYGFLMLMLRLYLLMMLVNLYQKSNIFAICYYVCVLVFWFQPLKFSMVRHINKIAIVILLLQYVVLLLDINNNSSPLVLPVLDNLSVLDKYIKNVEWRNYIVNDFGDTKNGSFVVSFLISSIIVFLTEFYFTLFFYISRRSIGKIREIYDRYEYITENLDRMPLQDTIYLNYENYKNWGYRFMTLSYELLLNNSYIFISYLILILLSTIHTVVAVGLVLFACVYIYIGIFTRFSQDKNIYQYTKIFFMIVQIILFTLLFIILLAEVPKFEQNSNVVIYIEGLANLGQIFLLFLIQIWIDLSVSREFRDVTLQYNDRVRNRENVMIKCIAYQENQDLIRRMLHRYKEAMWFEVNLKDALDIIDGWHKAMYKKKIPQFENLKVTKDSVHTMSLKSDIRAEQQKRPQQDQSIIERFTNFMIRNTSVALKYRYYEIMKYIVFNNHRLIDLQNCSIDIWDYVVENYQKLNEQVRQAENQLNDQIKIVQGEEIGDRMDKLEEIKLSRYSQDDGNVNMLLMGIIKTPQKIFIDIKAPKDSLSKIMLYFLLSNFEYFLSFFTWVYYMINPCLLSLPLIVYLFSYEIISYNKLTSVMLIYIFCIIILAMWVQIQNVPFDYWVKYLFYQDGDYTAYALGYLFFIFILIFINEQIKKYQGNKFVYSNEAQNRMQGAFRILLNEDKNSNINLWNYKIQQDQSQKEINPMNYFSRKIQEQVEYLTQCPQLSFFQSFNEGKTGIDLYPLIASVQIFLTIFLIFFYPFMVQSEISNFQTSFKYFQFSSNMVIGLLCHVGSIVIERRITMISPQNKNKSKIKYFYTMFILGLFLMFIYYIAPTSTQAKGIYQPSGFLVAFSFFYFFYFFLSALQIRFGYKKYKSLNSMMTKRRQLNNLVLVVFTAVPFLYELKLMMDYSFVSTSLKIWDWFRLWSIYYSAFKAKMQYYSSTGIILGNPQPWYAKLIGWGGFIGILIVIFGPMILFSGLNPIAQSNLVVGGALQLGIQIEGGNYFSLYSTSHFSSPPYAYSYQQFVANNFSQVQALQFLTPSDVSQQFQNVSFEPYSDQNWGISQPNFNTLINLMNTTLQQMNNKIEPTYQFSITVKYALDRRVSETLATDTSFSYPQTGYLSENLLQSIFNTFTTCNTSTLLPNFYISLIRLYTIGNSYKPRPINYTNSSGVDPYLEDVQLNLLCSNTNSTSQTNNVYWSLSVVNQGESNNGLFLNVLCDKYQNLIGGLGFTALYTSVILVVASFIRSAFEANLPQIPYYQNPKPDNIIQISEAIGTLRDRKQFREQYLMYYELIDIIRSPDLMKYLSGSFPVLIEKADAKRRKKEKDQEMQSRRDKIE